MLFLLSSQSIGGIQVFAENAVEGTEQLGYDNPQYTFRTIERGNIKTASEGGKTTVLIFGNVNCGYTQATVREIAGSPWVANKNIRVIFAECTGKTRQETAAFANQNAPGSPITFCYDDGDKETGIYSIIINAMFRYARLDKNLNFVSYPLTVLIDENNRVRKVMQGFQTAAYIGSELGEITGAVSKVEAVSGKNRIELKWNKVSKADGYIIYQRKGSGWKQIASVKSGKNSYTVQKLKPGRSYRFAVKTYVNQDKEQMLSKFYTSIYTATTPAAVSFKAAAGQGKVTLKWSKAAGATGYEIFYKTSENSFWGTLKKTKKTQFTCKNLESGKTYVFTVKAYKTYKGKTYIGKGRTEKVIAR